MASSAAPETKGATKPVPRPQTPSGRRARKCLGRTLEAFYRCHFDEFGIQRLLAVQAIEWTVVLLLGREERDCDGMQFGVLAAEQRGELLAKVVRALEKGEIPPAEPNRARVKPVQ